MSDRITDLLGRHPVIDGHNDLLWEMRELADYDFDRVDVAHDQIREPGPAAVPAGPLWSTKPHTDLPRLRAGGVGAQFWSVFVPCSQRERSVTATLEQIDAAYAMFARYAADLAQATTADEIEVVWTQGRIASLMGAEGGHQIGESLAVLRMLHRLGVRYLTLTHNDNVPWADSATDEPVLGGLSDFGRDVVREMNRIGMVADLSHVSADTMRDALEVTAAPVMFSHSSARAVCDHPRNVPDDVLSRLPDNGGLCMVTFVPRFVTQAVRDWDLQAQQAAAERGLAVRDEGYEDFYDRYEHDVPPPASTIDDVVAHLEHVREVAGIDHIGLGGDYDGTNWLPQGLGDVTGYPRLLGVLADRGWSDDDLGKLTSGNLLRTLRGVEAVVAGA